jgi:hypothetical protein
MDQKFALIAFLADFSPQEQDGGHSFIKSNSISVIYKSYEEINDE